jgi:hypothetical protein
VDVADQPPSRPVPPQAGPRIVVNSTQSTGSNPAALRPRSKPPAPVNSDTTLRSSKPGAYIVCGTWGSLTFTRITVHSCGLIPLWASRWPMKRASLAVTVKPSLYLSVLHSAVASLTLASTALRSGIVNAGFIGSINVTADVMASLHWARSSLIISSGSQAALGPAERNRISATFSDAATWAAAHRRGHSRLGRGTRSTRGSGFLCEERLVGVDGHLPPGRALLLLIHHTRRRSAPA